MIAPSGAPLIITDVGASFSLPVNVPAGLTVTSFEDPVTGVKVGLEAVADPDNPGQTVVRSVVRVPVKDSAGKTQLTIKATLSELTGTGAAANGQVERLQVEVPEQKANIPGVGEVAVETNFDVSSFPAGSSLQVSVSSAPIEPGAGSGITLFAQAAGSSAPPVIGVAVTFTKPASFDDVIGPAELTISVPKSFVDANGAGNIRATRTDDNGVTTQVVATPVDVNADPVVYPVVSPDGLSTFAIIALVGVATPTPEPTATPVPTAIPAPTATPRPTIVAPTPSPTPVPTATRAPQPTPTPFPTATPFATDTPFVTATPRPTATPLPATTPFPTPTPVPPTPVLEDDDGIDTWVIVVAVIGALALGLALVLFLGRRGS